MDDLFLSIGTLPFHERINAEKSIFSETDMLTMNNRAIRFKQKYYNDKTFTTPELIVQDNILSSLKENIQKIDENKQDNDDDAERIDNENDLVLINESKVFDKIKVSVNNIQLENVNLKNVNIALENVNLNKENPSKEEITLNNKSGPSYTDVSPTQGRGAIDNFEAFVLDNKDNSSELETIATEVSAQKGKSKYFFKRNKTIYLHYLTLWPTGIIIIISMLHLIKKTPKLKYFIFMIKKTEL